MCRMLYLAANADVPLVSSQYLQVEELEPEQEVVRQWFSLPTVRFVGAHTGCSCGFPSAVAEEPIEYDEGMFDDDPERADDLASVRALVDIVAEGVRSGGLVELFIAWFGDESETPKGTIDVRLSELDADRFFILERFLYRITM